MINQDKLKEEIIIMKKSILKLVREKDKNYIGQIEHFNQIVVLAVANFKCQNPSCGSEENLQIHHLIMRKTKEFMDYWRYASQRYYWANQIVLCKKCHQKFHKDFGGSFDRKSLCITQEKINEVKEIFK